MKTLDFLKDIKNNTPCEWKVLDEAIAELEELIKKVEASKEYFDLKLSGNFEQQENKSCKNCKNFQKLDKCEVCSKQYTSEWELEQ